MSFIPSLPLAQTAPAVLEVPRPLFGSVWLALLAVVACIAVFLVLVALFGRWLAATHPAPPPPAEPVVAPDPVGASAVTAAIIAAAVATMLGERARITAIRLATTPGPSVEMLMQQWSMEGRRQIYSSHKVR